MRAVGRWRCCATGTEVAGRSDIVRDSRLYAQRTFGSDRVEPRIRIQESVMVVIRLRRAGSKKRPFFRVVVTDSRAARDSSFVEILGHYNPRTQAGRSSRSTRIASSYWIGKGAQPSDSVRTLIARHLTPAPPVAAAGRGRSQVSVVRERRRGARARADRSARRGAASSSPSTRGRRWSSCTWRPASSDA